MPTAPDPTFTVLIDGECPLCAREARFMRRLDRGRNRLQIVDIAAADFDPATYGRSLDALMGTIHGVTADGTLVTGVEVFRRAYAAVGHGWLLAPTGWPVLRPIFDLVYRGFARIRPLLPRRGAPCTDGRCDVRG